MLKQHENLWETVLKAALLGTERQPPVLQGTPDGHEGDRLAVLLLGLDTANREGALLGAAATLVLYERAGQLPARGDSALPEPCAPDDSPGCSARAGTRLSLLLQGENRSLLPEWLAAASAAGRRVPDELLPDLLEAGRRQPDLREAIAPVLGRRGRWLAALNPAWSYVAGDVAATDEETWQTGTKATRVALLRRLRGQNPARAGELLAATWPQEPPKDRSEFLETFSVGLSMLDEPFLETALDDSRKETRTIAVDLLSRLPESRLVRRMIERVRPLVAPVSERKVLKLLKKESRIEVTLPGEFDKTMARDGIEEKKGAGGRHGLGEKAWWLQQMIVHIPPDFWCREWRMSPAQVLGAARSSEWPDMIVEGLRRATQLHRTPEWIEAFLAEAIERKQFTYDQRIESLPAPRLEAFTLAALASGDGRLSEIQTLISLCTHAWSTPFARTILDAVRREVSELATADKTQYHWLHAALKTYGRFVPPDMADEAASGWPTDAPQWEYWRRAVEEMVALVQFRHDMRQELLSD